MSYGYSGYTYHDGNHNHLSPFMYKTTFDNFHYLCTLNEYTELPPALVQHNKCDYPLVTATQPQYNPNLFVSLNSTITQLVLTSEEVRELLEYQERWLREEYQQEQGVDTPIREAEHHQQQHEHNNNVRPTVHNPPAQDHLYHALETCEVPYKPPVSATSHDGNLINCRDSPNPPWSCQMDTAIEFPPKNGSRTYIICPILNRSKYVS